MRKIPLTTYTWTACTSGLDALVRVFYLLQLLFCRGSLRLVIQEQDSASRGDNYPAFQQRGDTKQMQRNFTGKLVGCFLQVRHHPDRQRDLLAQIGKSRC